MDHPPPPPPPPGPHRIADYDQYLADLSEQELLVVAQTTGRQYAEARTVIATHGPRLVALARALYSRTHEDTGRPWRIREIIGALQGAVGSTWLHQQVKPEGKDHAQS